MRQLVRGNEPAEDLIEVAEEIHAELIVIGLRRRTPVGKLILGSNAQRILLDASCPVLAVKADRRGLTDDQHAPEHRAVEAAVRPWHDCAATNALRRRVLQW